MWSRSSSISSRKKESVDESVPGPEVYSRSNSVGEADKRSEDYIVLKVSRTQTSNYASSCAGTEIHLVVLEISQAKF